MGVGPKRAKKLADFGLGGANVGAEKGAGVSDLFARMGEGSTSRYIGSRRWTGQASGVDSAALLLPADGAWSGVVRAEAQVTYDDPESWLLVVQTGATILDTREYSAVSGGRMSPSLEWSGALTVSVYAAAVDTPISLVVVSVSLHVDVHRIS